MFLIILLIIIEIEQSFEECKSVDNSNKMLESLSNEFSVTLDNFKFDNYLNVKNIREQQKRDGNDYSKTMEELAKNIVNLASSGSFNSISMGIKSNKIKDKIQV